MTENTPPNFDPEHGKHATNETLNVASWIKSDDINDMPVSSIYSRFFEAVGHVPKQRHWHQLNVVLVHKFSKASPETILHCQSLPDAVLHKTYDDEYAAWRNMLRRCEDGIREVHPSFHDFRLFLAVLGRKPKPKYTLDRPNNCNLEYSPWNARWASKCAQNRNKGDNIVITCPDTGRKWFAHELAKRHGKTPDTIRTRRRRGWSDRDLIAGKHLPPCAIASVPPKIPTTTLEPTWFSAMATHFPSKSPVLTIAGMKQLSYFGRACYYDQALAANVLATVIGDWLAFVFLAATEYGLSTDTLPELPQPWFIAKCATSAINHWAETHGVVWSNGHAVLPHDVSSTSLVAAGDELAAKL